MLEQPRAKTEAERLEQLWAGDFGESYTERNAAAGDRRGPFWSSLFAKYPSSRVLEVGCNLGTNLRWICQHVPACEVCGVDISPHALERLRSSLPTVNAVWAPARSLPFRDGWFDLVFTAGVLIHQPEATLPLVMLELVRCSRRYVLCMEYFAERSVAVPYRGQAGALFKRNYGGIYQELSPELTLLEKGELTRMQGWDDITYWLFQKKRA